MPNDACSLARALYALSKHLSGVCDDRLIGRITNRSPQALDMDVG